MLPPNLPEGEKEKRGEDSLSFNLGGGKKKKKKLHIGPFHFPQGKEREKKNRFSFTYWRKKKGKEGTGYETVRRRTGGFYTFKEKKKKRVAFRPTELEKKGKGRRPGGKNLSPFRRGKGKKRVLFSSERKKKRSN